MAIPNSNRLGRRYSWRTGSAEAIPSTTVCRSRSIHPEPALAYPRPKVGLTVLLPLAHRALKGRQKLSLAPQSTGMPRSSSLSRDR